jgi:uncharacterized protein YuzE
MRVTYDDDHDVGYIYFTEDRDVDRTLTVKTGQQGVFGQLNIDIDAKGRVMGIEVLGVAATLPELANGFGLIGTLRGDE